MIYPLVMTGIAIENGHLQGVFPVKMVIFHSKTVSLLEGKWVNSMVYTRHDNCDIMTILNGVYTSS